MLSMFLGHIVVVFFIKLGEHRKGKFVRREIR